MIVDSHPRVGAVEPVARRALADEAYESIRRAILSGGMAAGTRLGETELAELLGVSRGPVREAIALLRQDGLVETDRHRGAVVTRLTLADAEEIYSLRIVTEQLAARRVMELGTAQELADLAQTVQEIREAADRGDDQEVFRLDIQFHDQECRAARHERLYSVWRGLRSQTSLLLLQRSSEQIAGYRAFAANEHQEILDGIIAKEADRVNGAIENHMLSALERAKAILPGTRS